MVVLRDHREPLAADLRHFYHCNLKDVLRGRVASLSEICAWVAHLPPDSAVQRSRYPDGSWQHTQELELHRAQLYTLDKIAYYTAKRAGANRVDQPEVFLFPWEEEDDSIKGDAMEVEEADDWLGWNAEMKAHLQGTPDLDY